jgi:hypothetical protein
VTQLRSKGQKIVFDVVVEGEVESCLFVIDAALTLGNVEANDVTRAESAQEISTIAAASIGDVC